MGRGRPARFAIVIGPSHGVKQNAPATGPRVGRLPGLPTRLRQRPAVHMGPASAAVSERHTWNRLQAPATLSASESIVDASIYVENYHAILEHVKSSIRDSLN
jgi:hypothetical protein